MNVTTKNYLGLIILVAVSLTFAFSTKAQEETEDAIIRGAHLYDNWMLNLGVDPPEEAHPLWESQENDVRPAAETWLCQTCHSWDYNGSDGAFRSAYPSLLGVVDLTTETVLAWLDGTINPDHDYSEILDSGARTDLAAFLKSGFLNVHAIADYETKLAFGDAESGGEIYNRICSGCHAVDGSLLNFGNASQPIFIADLALENPWSFIHRVRFGLPNNNSHYFSKNDNHLEYVGNLLAYAQSLPPAPPPVEVGEPELEIIDLEGEGDTQLVTIGAVVIVLVILFGIAWPVFQRRNN